VTNDGYTNVFKDIRFKITWPKDIQVIHDVISGYREENLPKENGIMIIGMPPKAGNRQLVAWFRSGREDINLFKVGEVEGYEK
jgi:hypothetical protein